MFQIDNDTVATSLPAVTSAGTPGYFTDGNAATGVAATILPAEFMNMLMMELANLCTSAGLSLDKSDYTQVTQAVTAMIADLATVTWDNVTDKPTTLTISGASTLGSTLSVAGAVTLAKTLTVTGAVTLDSTLNVLGACTFSAAVGISTTLEVAQAAKFDSTLTVTGGATLASASLTTSGSTATLTITDTGGSGANIKLAGSGTTTPNKYIRASAGNLEVVNSAYASVVFSVSDAGAVVAAGNITADGTVYSGGGTGYLAANGDTYGTTWGGLLSTYLTNFLKTASLPTALINIGYGGVGSYIMAMYVPGTVIDAGATAAGSSLRPAPTAGNANSTPAVMSGTWMCMGYCYGNSNVTQSTTLWMRIA